MVPGVMPVFVARVAADGSGSVLVGDWDGDGVRSYGVRVGSRVVFYSENSVLAAPVASLSLGRVSDRVFVGDWDGDGRDTLALVRGRSVFYQQVMESSATTAGRVPEGELREAGHRTGLRLGLRVLPVEGRGTSSLMSVDRQIP